MKKYRKPHRIKKKKSIIKNRFFGLGILIIIFIGSFFYFLFLSHFFTIEEVVISGNEKVSQNDIMQIVERELEKRKDFFSSDNIFLVNLGLIKEDILNKFPYINSVKIEKKLPSSLSFIITERKSVVVFCKDYESTEEEEEKTIYKKCFSLDNKGIVFEEVSEEDIQLPKIKNPNLKKEFRLGQEIMNPDLISKTLDISLGIESLEILIKEFLIISDEKIDLKTVDNWEIYFNPQKEINWQLTKLEAVLENIPLERRKDLEYIELRFGNLAPFKYENPPSAEP